MYKTFFRLLTIIINLAESCKNKKISVCVLLFFRVFFSFNFCFFYSLLLGPAYGMHPFLSNHSWARGFKGFIVLTADHTMKFKKKEKKKGLRILGLIVLWFYFKELHKFCNLSIPKTINNFCIPESFNTNISQQLFHYK